MLSLVAIISFSWRKNKIVEKGKADQDSEVELIDCFLFVLAVWTSSIILYTYHNVSCFHKLFKVKDAYKFLFCFKSLIRLLSLFLVVLLFLLVFFIILVSTFDRAQYFAAK